MKGGTEKPKVAISDRIFSMYQGTTSADGCNTTLFIFQLADYDINCFCARG
jgi:hypothetical protein